MVSMGFPPGVQAMAESSADPDLRQITTLWSVVYCAQESSAEAVHAARRRLLYRYNKAVHGYLRLAVRDDDVAADLAQEFAVRFLSGRLRGADAHKGRFRDYIKGVLGHLVADHFRRKKAAAPPLPPGEPEDTGPIPGGPECDGSFLASWRDQLLAGAW